MAIAIDDLGVANTSPLAVAPLDRGWTLYAHTPARGTPLDEATETTLVPRIWGSLRVLHDHQISHGDLRAKKITVDGDTVLFGGFDHAEYGATDAQLQSDIAQLLVTTSGLYDVRRPRCAPRSVSSARATVLTASRRLTKAAVPKRIRDVTPDSKRVLGTVPATRSSCRPAPTRSRPRRSRASTATRSSRWCCSSRWSTSRCRSSAPCRRSCPNCGRRTGGGACSDWRSPH